VTGDYKVPCKDASNLHSLPDIIRENLMEVQTNANRKIILKRTSKKQNGTGMSQIRHSTRWTFLNTVPKPWLSWVSENSYLVGSSDTISFKNSWCSNTSTPLGFKFQLQPRMGRFQIYSTLKCSHERPAVHRRRQRTKNSIQIRRSSPSCVEYSKKGFIWSYIV
jgi:hypothetical protein